MSEDMSVVEYFTSPFKRLDVTLDWYQGLLGTYDKQSWEESVEQRILQGLENRPKKTCLLKTELIDVDLIRGSAFTKSKPQHGWTAVLVRGVSRVLFLPFFYNYWKLHTSARMAKFILVHYFIQLLQIFLFLHNGCKEALWEEILVPMCLSLTLGILHAHIVSPHNNKQMKQDAAEKSDTAPSNNTPSSKKSRRRRKLQVRVDPDALGKEFASEIMETETALETESGVSPYIETVQSVNASNNIVQNGPNHIVKDVAEQRNDSRSKTEDEELKKFIDAKNKQIPDPVEYPSADRRRHRSHKTSTNANDATMNGTFHYLHDHMEPSTVKSRESSDQNSSLVNSRQKVYSRSSSLRQTEPSNSASFGMSASLSTKLKIEEYKEGSLKQKGRHFEEMRSKRTKPENRFSVSKYTEEDDHSHGHSADDSTESDSLNSEGAPPPDHDSRPAERSSSPPTRDSSLDPERESTGNPDLTKTENAACFLSGGNIKNEAPNDLGSNDQPPSGCPDASRASYKCQASSGRNFEVCQVTVLGDPECSPVSENNSNQIGNNELINSNPLQEIESAAADYREINEDTFTTHAKTKEQFYKIFRANAAGGRQSTATNSRSSVEKGENLPSGSKPSSLQNDDSSNETENDRSNTRSAHFKKGECKSGASETEYDRMNSDLRSSEDSTSEGEGTRQEAQKILNVQSEDPFVMWYRETHGGPNNSHASATESVSCYIWEGDQLKKADLTLLDIGWSIIQAVERHPLDNDYSRLGIFTALFLSMTPLLYRTYTQWSVLQQLPHAFVQVPALHRVIVDIPVMFAISLLGNNFNDIMVISLGVYLRLGLYFTIFFLLCVAERVFEQRLQYAKDFCNLTSSRRARKHSLPHFRLNKARNVKFWLSLRSYLKKRGPQRSVDSIISSAFYLVLVLMSVLCFNFLNEQQIEKLDLIDIDLLVCCVALSIFLLRFLTLGTMITKKYRNLSVLITEQINLYLAMEKKPHKKDELMIANYVLKLAEDVLKEVDSPFRFCGWSLNPLVYNILKVVILSACSAVMSRYMGFKLKLYKIKINPSNW